MPPEIQEQERPWDDSLKDQLNRMAEELVRHLEPWSVPDRTFLVDDYGARGDGISLNTVAIQSAIDACAAAGGGVVRFARGDYVTGTIELRSRTMLEIPASVRILGSTSLADYPERIAQRQTVMDTHMDVRQSLIFAEGTDGIGIRGGGTIDFRGTQEHFPGKQTTAATPGRPFGIRVLDSRNIVVDGITLKDSACWMQNYLNCENLIVQNMTVENHANHNNDGIDIDGCRRVIVRNCVINAEDDALCIKGCSLQPTEDVLIENCTFVSTCNAFKIGTDTQGDFRRILARNLRLGGIPETMRTWKGRQCSTGITLATVDGGAVEDVVITDVRIEGARCPLFLRRGDRGRVMPGMPKPAVAPLQRIVLERITGANNFRQGSLFSGVPGHRIRDVLVRDVVLDNEGGGTEEMATRPLEEMEDMYPDAQCFSKDGLPSYGFYIRHAENCRFERCSVVPRAADVRPEVLVGIDCWGVVPPACYSPPA